MTALGLSQHVELSWCVATTLTGCSWADIDSSESSSIDSSESSSIVHKHRIQPAIACQICWKDTHQQIRSICAFASSQMKKWLVSWNLYHALSDDSGADMTTVLKSRNVQKPFFCNYSIKCLMSSGFATAAQTFEKVHVNRGSFGVLIISQDLIIQPLVTAAQTWGITQDSLWQTWHKILYQVKICTGWWNMMAITCHVHLEDT